MSDKGRVKAKGGPASKEGYLTALAAFRERSAADPDAHPLFIYSPWCKKCGICVAVCPAGVLAQEPEKPVCAVAPERCTRCRMCELHCPDFAISVAEGRKAGKP